VAFSCHSAHSSRRWARPLQTFSLVCILAAVRLR
jgi:hypothetical protein